MTLREEYIEMRKSGKLDLVWFYKFYLEEYKKYPNKLNISIKNEFGSHLYEENGNEGEYKPKVIEIDRRELSFQEFAPSFSMTLSMYAPSIIEWCDIKMNIQKIEQNIQNKFEFKTIVEDKLIYIN